MNAGFSRTLAERTRAFRPGQFHQWLQRPLSQPLEELTFAVQCRRWV